MRIRTVFGSSVLLIAAFILARTFWFQYRTELLVTKVSQRYGMTLTSEDLQALHADDGLGNAALAGGGILLLFAVGWVITRLVERPVAELTTQAGRIARGEYTHVQVRGVAEISTLAAAGNAMADRLAAEDARRRRYTALLSGLSAGGGVSSVAHAALDALVREYDAVSGVIWVPGPEGGLTAAASVGVGGAPGSGSGVVIDAWQRGTERRFQALEHGGGHVLRSATGSVAPAALVVLPLTAGSARVGVLEACLARLDRVDAAELDRAVSSVGLALDNAVKAERVAALAVAVEGQRIRLETTLNGLSDSVLLASGDGAVLTANASARALFGSVDGLTLDGLRSRHAVAPAGDASGSAGERLRLLDGQGQERVVDWRSSGVPLFDGATGQVVSVRDVTEEHRLRERVEQASAELRAQNEELRAQEEELRAQSEELAAQQAELVRTNNELAQASHHKSFFLTTMSHELRTPLNAILGFSEVLLDEQRGPLNPVQKEALGFVQGAGRQLLLLIDDILDLSRIEAGRLELRAERVPLEVPLQEAIGLVAMQAARKRIRIEDRAAGQRLAVRADGDRVRQVLANLLSNAVKFTGEDGRIEIDAVPEGDHVRVSVTDTGIGIAPEDAARLFQPFSQLDAGSARRFQGTGLGLAISKRLVENMGGQIGVTGEPARGATFWFTLPAGSENAENVASPTRAPEPAPGAAPPVVLVVDDVEADRRLVEDALARAGYLVRGAGSAEAALAAVGELVPALVVIDVGLPGISGLVLAQRLRADDRLRSTCLVVLTARELELDERTALSGVADLIATKGSVSQTRFVAQLTALVPPSPQAPASRRRVLVVEDNDVNRRVVRAMLEALGCDVLEAPDGLSGMATAAAEQPDVVFMDIEMPGIDGIETTRRLLADPRTASIPVVALSAHAMASAAQRALDAGCVAFVSKPVARADLLRAMTQAGAAARR